MTGGEESVQDCFAWSVLGVVEVSLSSCRQAGWWKDKRRSFGPEPKRPKKNPLQHEANGRQRPVC
jgi:hypothetical protein